MCPIHRRERLDTELERRFTQLANPLVVRMCGANIDRETVENVGRAGFTDMRVDALWLDILKQIEARAPGS